MDKKGILIGVLLLCLLIVRSNASSWNWSNAQNGAYKNAYNITVSNWNYTATYGTSKFQEGSARYVLLNLSIIGNPGQITMLGYSSSRQNLGIVPCWYVGSTSNSVIFLVSNFTTSFTNWNSLTVFYNPTTAVNAGCLGTFQTLGFNKTNIKVINYNAPYISDNLLKAPRINQPWSNSTNTKFNFTLVSPTGFVLLANHSLVGARFNMSYFPDNLHGYQITNTLNTRYILTSYGTFGSSLVSNAPLNSQNANFIFTNSVAYDGVGFEGFFQGELANQIVSEGMIVNESASSLGRVYGSIFNSTTSKAAGLDINSQAFDFGLNISANIPTSIMIIPAFTRNNLVSNVLTNNNPNANPKNNTNFGFSFKTFFYNVNWTYQFRTSAFPKSGTLIPNGITLLNFSANNVSYMLLTLNNTPLEMGPSCQYVNFRGYNNQSGSDLGPIPFSVISCNPNNAISRFVLYNTTLGGFNYNAFYMFYGSQFNNTPNYANAMVLNNWQFLNTSTGVIIPYINAQALDVPGGRIPFTISLSQIMNTHSSIALHYNSILGQEFYMANNGITSAYVKYPGASNAPAFDPSGFSPTTFLVFNDITLGPLSPAVSLFTSSLSIWQWTSSAGWFASNSVASPNDGFGDTSVAPFNLTLGNGYAVFRELDTVQVTKGLTTIVISNASNGTGRIPTRIASGIPKTANRLNLTNTTTINWATLSQPIILFGTTSFPKYWFGIIALMCILIGILMLGKTKHDHFPFALMILGLWISALWQIPLLIVAIIFTSLYVLHIYTK